MTDTSQQPDREAEGGEEGVDENRQPYSHVNLAAALATLVVATLVVTTLLDATTV